MTPARSGERIDNVVRGLISIGVRQGEHVGVLMGAAPERAGGRRGDQPDRRGRRADAPRRRPAARGPAGPDRADRRRPRARRDSRPSSKASRHSCSGVAAGRAGPWGRRDATDMEQIDPSAVTPPRWYRPNPGRAGDLAFIVFSGEGEYTRASRITNRRWAQSAFGTASSAALRPADTRLQRYAGLPPVRTDDEHRRRDRRRRSPGDGPALRRVHLLGGGQALRGDGGVVHLDDARRGRRRAAAAGASDTTRCACSSARVCRAASGGGSRSGSSRRVCVEFYASTEAGAILVNLGGAKLGSMGRPLARQRRGADRRLRPRGAGS